MTIDELQSLQADKVVDARGMACPGPILAAKRGIGDVPALGVMEVMATDSGALKDLSAWSKKTGNDYLGNLEETGYLRLFVKKTS